MEFEDIQVVGEPLVRATPNEVDALASQLWITFPDGYREYVTRLGEGVLGGTLVRIFPPWRIEKELIEWRRRIGKYWFWNKGRDLLPKERALECLIIGDTLNGDELVFHPSRPGQLFVLPGESETVFEAGSDLLSAVEWMCASGKLVDPFEERNFEPFDSRTITKPKSPAEVVDPEGESLDDLVELAKRWAKRHSVRQEARKDFRQQAPTGAKTELLSESIVLEGESSLDVGYALSWRVVDKESGNPLGVFRWTKGDVHRSSAYEPLPKK